MRWRVNMDIRLTTNEFDLVRAIVANRLEALTDTATLVTNDNGTRRAALTHHVTVAELLIALDSHEENDDGS
jgi:hypothetical protein